MKSSSCNCGSGFPADCLFDLLWFEAIFLGQIRYRLAGIKTRSYYSRRNASPCYDRLPKAKGRIYEDEFWLCSTPLAHERIESKPALVVLDAFQIRSDNLRNHKLSASRQIHQLVDLLYEDINPVGVQRLLN